MISVIIGFSKSKNPTIISKTIGWFEGTEYTHVYLMTTHLVPAKIVLHADEFNVHIISENNFLRKSIVVHQYRVYLTQDELAKFLTMALDMVGKPYSYKQLFVIAFNKTMKLWNFKFRIRYQDDSSSIICSELIERFLFEIKGVSSKQGPDAVTPKDIKVICDSLGFEKIDEHA